MLTIGQCIKINAMLDEGLVGMDMDGHLVSPNEPICVEDVINTTYRLTNQEMVFLKCHFIDDDYCISYFTSFNHNENYLEKAYSARCNLPYARRGVACLFRNIALEGSCKPLWVYAEAIDLDYNNNLCTQSEIVNALFHKAFGCDKFPIIFQEDE